MAWLICGHCGRHNTQGSESCASCGIDLSEPLHEETEETPSTVWLICAHCGRHNAQGSESCASCGKGLNEPLHGETEETPSTSGLICKDCGRDNAPDSNFCSSCGTRLELGDPAQADIGAPEADVPVTVGVPATEGSEARPPVTAGTTTKAGQGTPKGGRTALEEFRSPGSKSKGLSRSDKQALGLVAAVVVVGLLVVAILAGDEGSGRVATTSSPATPIPNITVSTEGQPLLAVQPFQSNYRRVRTLVGGTGHRKVDAETYSQVRDLVAGEKQYPTPQPSRNRSSEPSAEDLQQVWEFCGKVLQTPFEVSTEDFVRLGRLDVANISQPNARKVVELVARGRQQTDRDDGREVVLEFAAECELWRAVEEVREQARRWAIANESSKSVSPSVEPTRSSSAPSAGPLASLLEAQEKADSLSMMNATLDEIRRVVPQVAQGDVVTACQRYEYLIGVKKGFHGSYTEAQQAQLFRQTVEKLSDAEAAVLGVLISVETRGGNVWISGPDGVIAQCYAMMEGE